MEKADTAKPDFKKRSQFRVSHSQLGVLYQSVVEQNLMWGHSQAELWLKLGDAASRPV